MRKPIIAGNWKMHKNVSETKSLINELKSLLPKDDSVEVVICPPHTSLAIAVELVKGTNIKIGAQNMHWENEGAYTGEISSLMLKELGVSYCIVGHSERRQYFKETDENVNKKVLAALENDINPIICVGETLEEKEKGATFTVCEAQVKKALEGIDKKYSEKIVIAYEPVWAIGTGKTASSDDAQEVISHIRKTLKSIVGEKEGDLIRIQYGGSVNPENIASFMEKDDIDGALVGGASLKAASFAKIVKF